MDNKIGIGVIMVTFIGVIVGVILFQAIAQNVGSSTDTITLANSSFTLGEESGSVYLTDYKLISDVVIYNATGDLVPADNYTVTNNVVYNGGLAVQITTGVVNEYANDSANISGTAQPLTYISESGGRSMALLIPIFFALMILAIALIPTARSELIGMIGK